MADYIDEDDLHDYANEDEDEITSEDDEKINQLIPEVKAQLVDYTGYNYDDIYNELWETYLDVPETVKNLKKRFKKKPTVKPVAKESKLAMLAKSRNRGGLSGLINNGQDKRSTELTSVSILDSLNVKNGQGKLVPSKSVVEGSKLSKLAALRLAKSRIESNKQLPKMPQQELSKMPQQELSNKELPNKESPKKQIDQNAEKSLSKNKKKNIVKTFEDVLPQSFHKLDSSDFIFSKFTVDKSLLCANPRSSFSVITVNSSLQGPVVERVKLFENYLQSVYYPVEKVITNNEILVANGAAIKSNFQKPSPDDRILNAQSSKEDNKHVEQVVSGITNLTMKPKVTKPKKPLDLKQVDVKPNLSFAVIGHVDAGKSTLMGMFLKSLNKVDKNFLRKLEEESAKLGKKSFALAWILDQTKEERSRGVTVDICTTSVDTPKANFIIIDAPGHRDYVPRMISGVAQADIGLLIIDANYDGFENGFSYDGQTKEHALLSYCLGLRKLVIVLNKLDMVNYDQGRYNDIKTRLETFLVKSVGFDLSQVVFVPVSGLDGTNVVKKPAIKELQWYSGPTLLQVLEQEAEALAKQEINTNQTEKFVFQISDVNTDFHQASEFALVGRVNSGAIQPGETVSISPGSIYLQIDSIKSAESTSGKEIEVYKNRDYALKYDNNVSLIFKDKKAKEELKANIDLIKPGDLVSSIDSLIPPTTRFTCEIKLFDLRGFPLLPGAKMLLHSGANERPVEITKFISEINPDKKKSKKKILHLGSHKQAIVEVDLIDESSKSPRPLPLLTYSQNSRLGRVVFRRDGITIGAGKVLSIV